MLKQVQNGRVSTLRKSGGTVEMVTEKEVVKVGTKVISSKDGKMSIPSLSGDSLSSIFSDIIAKLIISGVDGSNICIEEFSYSISTISISITGSESSS